MAVCVDVDLTLDSDDDVKAASSRTKRMNLPSQILPRQEEMIELTEEERQGQCAFLQHHFVGADEGMRKRCAQPLSEKEGGKAPRRQAKRRKPGVLCTIQHVNAGAFDLTEAEMACLSADDWVNDEV
jgi:hypothetical protein